MLVFRLMSESLKQTSESPNDNNRASRHESGQPITHQQIGSIAAECFSRNQETFPDPYPYDILKYRDEETTNKLQRSYVRYTNKLVEKINEDEIDHAVFLDKSARPVAWMMNELWDSLAATDEEVSERPDESFLNIDREQWRDTVGGKEIDSGIIDVSKIDQTVIDSLRYIFVSGTKADKDGNNITLDSVWEMPTVLDGKKVLVVDEVKFTGDSARIAQKLLRRAIPEADIQEPYHWMDSKSAGKDLPDIPMWYSDKTEKGRWVNDRSRTESIHSSSRVQREGYMFLSTRQQEVDSRSQKLRAECKALARDYEQGKYGAIK